MRGAVKLADGIVHGLVGLGTDNIHDGLGLGQIYTAVEKGTLGKLARLSHSSTLANQELKDFVGNGDASVGVNLNDIFAREGTWRTHDTQHDLVKHLPCRRVNNVAVVEAVARNSRQILALENLAGNGKCIRPRQADNPNGTLTERS